MESESIKFLNEIRNEVVWKIAQQLKLRHNFLLAFVNANSINVFELYRDIAYGELKPEDLITAISGEKGNIINKYGDKLNESFNKSIFDPLQTSSMIINKEDLEKTIQNRNERASIEIFTNSTPVAKINKVIQLNSRQFKRLIAYIKEQIQNGQEPISLNEALEDTMTFEVYHSRLQKFLDFVEKQPSLSVVKKTDDGAYTNVKIHNSSSFECWLSLTSFYRDTIKI
ncbi:MAG: hypothetical protein NTZ33_04895 [Bacteroidetes bacterium]|nr:hypothetical protein [Bacteroidota bacterium]